jgi:hypothetical protein
LGGNLLTAINNYHDVCIFARSLGGGGSAGEWQWRWVSTFYSKGTNQSTRQEALQYTGDTTVPAPAKL